MNTSIGDEVIKIYGKELSGGALKKPIKVTDVHRIIVIQSLVILAGIVFVVLVAYFNKFIVLQQEIYAESSLLEKEYERRNSVLPKLAAIATEYAQYEKEVLRYTADVRALKMFSEKVVEGSGATKNTGIQKTLTKLLALTEQYPNLKATETFQTLMEKIETTEDRIAKIRGIYVSKMNEYNVLVKVFPDNIFAGIFRFKQFPFYTPETDPKPVRDARIYFNARWMNWLDLIQFWKPTDK